MSTIPERIEKALDKILKTQKKIHESRNWDAWDIAQEILGYPGAMVSGTKISLPGHKVVWNANVCTKEHGKIWFGDIDLTVDEDKIKLLAQQLNTRVYILYEMDARFDNESNPLFKEAILSIDEIGNTEWRKN